MIANKYVTLEHYLILSSIIFVIAVSGLFIFPKNLLKMIMSIELMLVSININFVSFSCYLENILGQIFSIVLLSVAAAEIALGFAIIILFYKKRKSIELENIKDLKE
ncbi:MAG: NADH-quinone oxidoreductase subunit NuoK [Rickettsia sp.]|nr:NADH-quinone oxidoreductase subunit NuoK [Rickettsia sp.]